MLAVGQTNGTIWGQGAPPILVYVSGDWHVHWGDRILTQVKDPLYKETPAYKSNQGWTIPGTCADLFVHPSCTCSAWTLKPPSISDDCPKPKAGGGLGGCFLSPRAVLKVFHAGGT